MDFTLSVIIPNYNNGEFINKCVESVLKQTLNPDEIIIVDDKSTDKSAEIIKELEERYKIVKGIYMSENKGVSYARNIGAQYSTCNYITFLDADDFYYSSSKLAKEMDLIKKFKMKNKNIISYSGVVRVDKDGNYINDDGVKKVRFIQGNIHLKLIAQYKPKRTPRDYCLLKEVFIQSGGYNENMSLYEDLDLLIRLSKLCRVYYTGNFGTAYRLTNQGLSSVKSINKNIVLKKILDTYYSGLNIFEKISCNILRNMQLTFFEVKKFKDRCIN